MVLEKSRRVRHLDPQTKEGVLRHTSSNKATPASTRAHLLIVTLPLRLWGPIAFKLPLLVDTEIIEIFKSFQNSEFRNHTAIEVDTI